MKIGFIGLGDMGFPLARNLLKNKHKVFAYDIDQTKINQIKKYQAIPSPSLKQLSLHCPVVILCLSKPKISQSVIFGKNGLLNHQSSIKTIIETSTLDPTTVQQFQNKLKKHSINFLSTPMLGRPYHAQKKLIHFLVEGDKKTYRKNKPLLMTMGNKTTYLGQPPQATLAKLIFNLCRFSNLATAIEAADILHQYSPNIKPIYKLLIQSSKTNFGQVWEKSIHDYILNKTPYTPSQTLIKDLQLITQLAKNKTINAKITQATKQKHQSLRKKYLK